jgi:hypothetical protein
MAAYSGNPNIITDGLVICLDAANPKSYPGTGSIWFDISGNNNHMTLYNNPTFSATNFGVIQLNGTNQYGIISLNYSTTSFTIMGAARYSGSTRGRIISAANNNWLLGHWSNSTENYYAEGWVTSGAATGTSDTNWRIFTATENYSADQRNIYVNNVNTSITTNGGSQGFNNLGIGRYGPSNTEYSTGEVSFILVYNRILSTVEITQLFNNFRGRFGI